MDPEIIRALRDGQPVEAIAAELQRRGLPVPPNLQAVADSLAAGSGPSPFAQAVNDAAVPAAAAGTLGAAGFGLYKRFSPSGRGKHRIELAARETPGGPQALIDRFNEFKAAGRGDLVTLGDLSPRLGAEADFVATSNEPARAILGELHAERQGGVPARVRQDLTELAPSGYVAPAAEAAGIGQAKADFAASERGFEGLRQQNLVLRDPASLAGELRKPENKPLMNAYLEARAQSLSAGGTGQASFRMLQDVKRDLDQRISSAFAAGNGDLAKELKDARARLYGIMEEQVGPQYREAVATYRSLSRQEELLQEGIDVWSSRQLQPPDIEQVMRRMNPEELETFRRGVAGGLFRDIENARTTGNVSRGLLKESLAQKEKMVRLIFGDKATFDAFMRRQQLEDALARMGEVVGQSATARRQQQLFDPVEAGVDALTSGPISAGRSLAGKASGFVARRTARSMVPALTARGTALEELLRTLARVR